TGSRGREGYREFPLLTSGKIWAGETFSYYVLTSPELDTLTEYSYINGIHECNIVPV
ncbi:BgtE-10021, partial [Blumeria graminis f. sp. tritici]